MSDFLLGINYWPRRSAMYMWQRFDAAEIREDMALLSMLGMRVVRFFLLWEDFQPSAHEMDRKMLDNLVVMMDAVAEAKMVAMPTLFTGHMSGLNWLPEWALDAHTPAGRFRTYSRGRPLPFGIGDFYTGKLLEAQVFHARAVGERLRGHPALWMWDLGNEFSNLREPKSPADAANWSQELTEALFATSDAPVTAGTHGEDLTRDRNIRLSSLSLPFELATMHGYSVYSEFARDRLDTDVVPFLLELAQSCAQKPVLFSEFGNPTCPPGTVSPYDRVPLPGDPPIIASMLPHRAAPYACLTEEEMSVYAHDVLDRLQKSGAAGAFWWCYADYAAQVSHMAPFDRAPHELSFGIIRQDGSPKPVATTLKSFSREKRQIVGPPAPIVNEQSYYEQLPASLDDAYRRYTNRAVIK